LADGYLLEAAFIELVQNSKVFIARPKDLQISIVIEPEIHGSTGWVKITYKDNGPGVPPEFKERIFKQFFSRRPGQEKSTGIGLRFVHRVVRAHRGVVTEVGTYGGGAEFLLKIPRFFSQDTGKGDE
jgi:signal transduction histidine kinase